MEYRYGEGRMTKSNSFHFIEVLRDTLREEKMIPMWGHPPAFPWDAVSESCTRIFDQDTQIKIGTSQWMDSVQLRQPITVKGLALQLNDLQGNVDDSGRQTKTLCIFADRPQWNFPSTVAPLAVDELQPEIKNYLLHLGKQHWDLALLDTLQRNNQRSLDASESAAFYSLLSIMGSPDRLEDQSLRVEQVTPLEAITHSFDNIARPVDWPVRLVTGSLVEVVDSADQSSLGSDRYFQFDGFLRMPNQTIHYQAAQGQQAIDFNGEFPVTLVMVDPPEFLLPAVDTSSERTWKVGQYARAKGVFYRLWSYHSAKLDAGSPQSRQAAPLVVASHVVPDVPQFSAQAPTTGWFGYALCLAVLAILGVILTSVFQTMPRRSSRRND